MKRLAALLVFSVSLMTVPAAFASEPEVTPGAPAAATTAAAVGAPAAVVPTLSPAEWLAARRRPSILPALYVGFAGLQVFDAYSTQRAIAGGAHEANPMMKTVAGNPVVFWSVKAAITVAPMIAAERLWKSNKVAAIAVMAVSNGVMIAVAAHNAGVIRSQR